MKKLIVLLFVPVILFSCKQSSKFKVSGTVDGAPGEMLYLEHSGLLKTTTLDSVKLDEKGTFSFKSACPEYPDFYNLKLNNKIITFAVDSCEKIIIAAKNTNFATDYTVTGSETSVQIQQLRKSVMNIQRKLNELSPTLGAAERQERVATIQNDIETHKAYARELILKNARSASAYFAIYQQVNNTYLFSPYVKQDRPYCAAVATAYHTFMPDYVRSQNLYNLVMDAIRSERLVREKEAWAKVMDESGKGYIDITLKDQNNTERKLSSLEGKVVLIDFSAYESAESVDYTFALRDLYNKYNKRGFEIYQVSLDKNKLLWETSVENIPWVTVRDENGPNTVWVSTYNIQSIPTHFLLDRKGNIIARGLGFAELAKEIEKRL